MNRRWAREEAKARRDLQRNRATIESTRTGTPGTREPGGRTKRKREGRI